MVRGTPNKDHLVIKQNEYQVELMTRLTYNTLEGGVTMLSIGEKFSLLRNRSGLTQSQIAEYLDVDQSYISKCEKNERQFSVDILEKAAALLGCPIEYFTDETSQFAPIPIALRAKSVTTEDLATIAAINKIALNLRFMEGLLEGE